MARKQKNSFKKRPSVTIPLTIVAGSAPFLSGLWGRRNAGAKDIGIFMTAAWTGYVPGQGFNHIRMQEGALPFGVGLLAHKIANKLGVNRTLAKMRIPLIRI